MMKVSIIAGLFVGALTLIRLVLQKKVSPEQVRGCLLMSLALAIIGGMSIIYLLNSHRPPPRPIIVIMEVRQDIPLFPPREKLPVSNQRSIV